MKRLCGTHVVVNSGMRGANLLLTGSGQSLFVPKAGISEYIPHCPWSYNFSFIVVWWESIDPKNQSVIFCFCPIGGHLLLLLLGGHLENVIKNWKLWWSISETKINSGKYSSGRKVKWYLIPQNKTIRKEWQIPKSCIQTEKNKKLSWFIDCRRNHSLLYHTETSLYPVQLPEWRLRRGGFPTRLRNAHVCRYKSPHLTHLELFPFWTFHPIIRIQCSLHLLHLLQSSVRLWAMQ